MQFDYQHNGETYQLNYDEHQRVAHADDLERKQQQGGLVLESQIKQAQQVKANQLRNAQLRAERRAALQTAEAEQERARQAERDAAALQAQERYMAQRRAAFRGTQAQWDAMKARVLEEYLLGGGAGDQEQLVESLKASGRYGEY